MNIYQLLSGLKVQEIEKKYQNKGYADFKKDLAEITVNYLAPIQKRLAELSDEKVLKILKDGAKKADKVANTKLAEVQKKMGFVR